MAVDERERVVLEERAVADDSGHVNPYAPIAGPADQGARRSLFWLLPSLPLYGLSGLLWLSVAIEVFKEAARSWWQLWLYSDVFFNAKVIAGLLGALAAIALFAAVAYGLWRAARRVHRGKRLPAAGSPLRGWLSLPIYLLAGYFWLAAALTGTMAILGAIQELPMVGSGLDHIYAGYAASVMTVAVLLFAVGYGVWRVARRVRSGRRRAEPPQAHQKPIH